MNDQTIFEYVVGTLPREERAAFEQALAQDPELQRQVRFWEEHLMVLNESLGEVPPKPDTWTRIERRIQPHSLVRKGLAPWYWLSAMAATLLIGLTVVFATILRESEPNMDYVAVLTGQQGEAMLTALTSGEDKVLWLQWEPIEVTADASLQLWARSKRDGQVRSLAVFDTTGTDRMALSEASWRLINDAQELLLTREEKGGSPLGEPSEVLIAKGVCVRLRKSEFEG